MYNASPPSPLKDFYRLVAKWYRGIPSEITSPRGQDSLPLRVRRLQQTFNRTCPPDQLGHRPRSLHDRQSKRHAANGADTAWDGDDRIACLGADLVTLGDVRRHQEP